jgi:hypothetical protein
MANLSLLCRQSAVIYHPVALRIPDRSFESSHIRPLFDQEHPIPNLPIIFRLHSQIYRSKRRFLLELPVNRCVVHRIRQPILNRSAVIVNLADPESIDNPPTNRDELSRTTLRGEPNRPIMDRQIGEIVRCPMEAV